MRASQSSRPAFLLAIFTCFNCIVVFFIYPQVINPDFIYEFPCLLERLGFALGIGGNARAAGGPSTLVMRRVRSLFCFQWDLRFAGTRYASRELHAANP
jgi:hypothetical protein